MSDDQWGPGDREQWKDHGTVLLDGQQEKLIYGEHPHSRNDNRHYVLLHGDKPVAFSGHRICTRVEIVEANYLRSSGISGSEVKSGGEARIYFDDHLIYTKSFRVAERALLWVATNLQRLKEHSVRLWEFDDQGRITDLVDRKVRYKGKPGIVTHYFPDQGAVVIKYDGDGQGFVTPAWLSLTDEREVEDSVKTDLLSEHIWWWRDEKPDGAA